MVSPPPRLADQSGGQGVGVDAGHSQGPAKLERDLHLGGPGRCAKRPRQEGLGGKGDGKSKGRGKGATLQLSTPPCVSVCFVRRACPKTKRLCGHVVAHSVARGGVRHVMAHSVAGGGVRCALLCVVPTLDGFGFPAQG